MFNKQPQGIHIRDFFAMHAMVGIISSGRFNSKPLDELSPKYISNASYEIADAMLDSRNYPTAVTS